MIVLNLKTYRETFERIDFYASIVRDIAKESGVRIVLAPPFTCLSVAALIHKDVFAQHVDPNDSGAFTGSVPAEALLQAKTKGSLLNHSEKKLPHETIKRSVEQLRKNKLQSIVCADSIVEVQKLAVFAPDFIAIEPPELIGSGISVSNARPDIIVGTVAALRKIDPKVRALCGAGVSNAEDVRNALKLGTEGVLLASAFVKAKDPAKFLESMAAEF